MFVAPYVELVRGVLFRRTRVEGAGHEVDPAFPVFDFEVIAAVQAGNPSVELLDSVPVEVSVEKSEVSHVVFPLFLCRGGDKLHGPEGRGALAPQHLAELFEGGDAVRLDEVLVLRKPGHGLLSGPGLNLELPCAGHGLVNPQGRFQTLATASGQAVDELLPGEHPEQGREAVGVGLQLGAVHAVGHVVDAGVDNGRVEGQVGRVVGVGERTATGLGLADDVRFTDVQLPVMLRTGAAPDVVGRTDAVRHEVVTDGVVSPLAVRSGGTTALAGLGDVFDGQTGFHGRNSGELFDLLHDDDPLSVSWLMNVVPAHHGGDT